MDDALSGEIGLQNDLREALANDRLSVAYQPVYDARSGRPVYVEALARWPRSPDPDVGPARFIPIAERSGLIDALGRWVLRTACRDIAALPADCEFLRLSVNVSPEQLVGAGFARSVDEALRQSGLGADRLMLELTESTVPDPDGQIARQLHDLRALGVALAVDDFGTGHSSLGRLHRLPFTVLKIDKSFIDTIVEPDEPEVILDATVAMAHGLEMVVIAEGVETAVQLNRLRLLGCDLIQGFLLGRPMTIADLRAHLRRPPAPIPAQPDRRRAEPGGLRSVPCGPQPAEP